MATNVRVFSVSHSLRPAGKARGTGEAPPLPTQGEVPLRTGAASLLARAGESRSPVLSQLPELSELTENQ